MLIRLALALAATCALAVGCLPKPAAKSAPAPAAGNAAAADPNAAPAAGSPSDSGAVADTGNPPAADNSSAGGASADTGAAVAQAADTVYPPDWPLKELTLPEGYKLVDSPDDSDGPPGWLDINRAMHTGQPDENSSFSIGFKTGDPATDVRQHVESILGPLHYQSYSGTTDWLHSYLSPDKRIFVQLMENSRLPQGGWTYFVTAYKNPQKELAEGMAPLP